jgi:putative oxidoreductase
MAAFAEFVGGILLMLGFVFRPALVILSGTMIVAAIGHTFGDIGGGPWHATEMLTVFIALLITGPGAYSLDTLFFGSSDPYA